MQVTPVADGIKQHTDACMHVHPGTALSDSVFRTPYPRHYLPQVLGDARVRQYTQTAAPVTGLYLLPHHFVPAQPSPTGLDQTSQLQHPNQGQHRCRSAVKPRFKRLSSSIGRLCDACHDQIKVHTPAVSPPWPRNARHTHGAHTAQHGTMLGRGEAWVSRSIGD